MSQKVSKKFSVEKISRISLLSVCEGWPYSRTFAELQAAGVESYSVDFSHSKLVRIISYHGEGESWFEEKRNDNCRIRISDFLQPSEIEKAIDLFMEKKISFLEYLQCISTYGVCSYTVDLTNHEVSYLGVGNQVYKTPARV